MIPADLPVRVEFARRTARGAGALAPRYFPREIDFVAGSKGVQDSTSTPIP
jgi:hypothetical protein